MNRNATTKLENLEKEINQTRSGSKRNSETLKINSEKLQNLEQELNNFRINARKDSDFIKVSERLRLKEI